MIVPLGTRSVFCDVRSWYTAAGEKFVGLLVARNSRGRF